MFILVDFLFVFWVVYLSYLDMKFVAVLATVLFQLLRELSFVSHQYLLQSANIRHVARNIPLFYAICLLATENNTRVDFLSYLVQTSLMHFALILISDISYGRVVHKLLHKYNIHSVHRIHHVNTTKVTVLSNYDVSIYEIILLAGASTAPLIIFDMPIPFASFLLFIHSSALQHSANTNSPFFFNPLDLFINTNIPHKEHHRHAHKHVELVPWSHFKLS